MEKFHLTEGDLVLKHCNDQYTKVKSMSERVQSISDNLQSHSDKVALLANGASKLINLELEQLKLCDKYCDNDVPISSSANDHDLPSIIHKKLDEIMIQSEHACKNVKTKQVLRKSNAGSCSQWNGEDARDQLPRDLPRDSQLQQYMPSLPTTSTGGCDGISRDGISSCTESDFIPASCDGDTSFDDSTTSSFCKEMHDKHPELLNRQLGVVNSLASASTTIDRSKMTEEELNFMNESERNSFIDGCEKSRYFIENHIQPQVDFINKNIEDEKLKQQQQQQQVQQQQTTIYEHHQQPSVFVFDQNVVSTDIPSTSYSTDTTFRHTHGTNRLTKYRGSTKQLRPRDNLRERRLLALHGIRVAARCRSSYHLSSTRGTSEAKAAHALKKSKSYDSAPCPVKRLKSTQSEIVFS